MPNSEKRDAMDYATSPSSFAYACLHHPLFGARFRYATYKGTEIIHAAGSPIKEFGLVVEGCLKAIRYTGSGKEVCSSYFEKDDFFPELLYFADKKTYTYTLVAAKRSNVMWVTTETFERMLREDQDLMYAFMIYLSKRGLKNQMLLGCLGYQTIRERIAFWLVNMSDLSRSDCVPLPASQTIWANTLRVSRSSLNQEIKKMEKLGYFSMRGSMLIVRDRAALENLL